MMLKEDDLAVASRYNRQEDPTLKNTTRRRTTTKPSGHALTEEIQTALDNVSDPAETPVAPVSAPPVAPSPAGTIVVWKRYSETTGGPQVAVRFQMGDPSFNREYVFDVTTAEAVADQILEVCDQHREDFDPEWFADQPTVQR
jgi:hypothetical protein